MTVTPNSPPHDEGSAPLVPESTGSISVRKDIVDRFLAVRKNVDDLQAVLHQTMRRVALPRCKRIGDDLHSIASLYPKGKRGRAGGVSGTFFRDAEVFTSLKKRSLQGYMTVSTNWERLMDYMADLPEGATPIVSLRGALEAIRAMNAPEKPALPEDSVDVAAEEIQDDDSSPSRARTRYAATTREKVMPALSGLFAAHVLTDRQREQLEKVRVVLEELLDNIDATEAAAAESAETSPQIQSPDPMWPAEGSVIDTPQVEEPVPAPTAEKKPKVKLKELYPDSQAGLDQLEADIAEHGSGSALARHLGCSKAAISMRLKALRQAVASE